MSEIIVPESVSSQLTATVAREIAAVYEDDVVYPDRIAVDEPGDPRRIFTGWPTPVLLILIENQGACEWGVSLDGPDPVVLITGHDYVRGVWQRTTMVHAPNVSHFIAARRWDKRCRSQEPQLWADASDELDEESLTYLRAHFDEVLPTPGYPARTNYRFQDGTSMVMVLTSGAGCEWRISSSDMVVLERLIGNLFTQSNIRHALRSIDPAGEALLARLRAE